MHLLHKVAHKKLATTMASLKMAGIQDYMNIIEKEATFIGKTQYPNKLALWKKVLYQNIITFLNQES